MTADLTATTEDLTLPDGGVLTLVTLDNGSEKPITLTPRGMTALRDVLAGLRVRARAGEIAAVALTGRRGCFAAGADLRLVGTIQDADAAREVGRLGHETVTHLLDLEVPTFAFIEGLALGGGLELALACRFRTVAADVTALAFPETYLGLVPGWGGCTLLPRLVGLAQALTLILDRPLANNRTTSAAEARRLGLVDVVLDPDGFRDRALTWAGDVVAGRVSVERARPEPELVRHATLAAARERLARRYHGTRPAPLRALDLVAGSYERSREESFAAEDEALAELIPSEELRASLYAFDLVTRRARVPAGVPDAQPRAVRKVGIVGAGLMACQLAVLVARRLQVPVALREIDEDRAEAGRRAVSAAVSRLVDRGRMTAAEGERLQAGVTVSTDLGDLAGSDLVIEAVTEVLGVKQQVFAQLEGVVDADAILATNTSALSVAAMADGLAHPERVVGLHFFNPVDRMPLVEVVRTERVSPTALATAFHVAAALGKTAIRVADRPGFVVNRLLLRLLAEVAAAVEAGTPVQVADRALRPLGLPMGPFALMQLVGLPVALHVLRTLHEEFGERYPLSPGLEAAAAVGVPLTEPGEDGLGDVTPAIQRFFGRVDPDAPGEAAVLERVVAALREEVDLMLAEGVVEGPEQIDIAVILGAGWPLQLGGITPFLARPRD